MDTFVEIQAIGVRGDKEKMIAIDEALALIKDLEEKLNYFSTNSEVAKINKLLLGEKYKLSKDLFSILKLSRQFSRQTNGAFTISIGALSELWANASSIPNANAIEKAKIKTGISSWQLNDEEQSFVFLVTGAQINLGAVAKGFIVDSAAEYLTKSNIDNFIINAGGDMYGKGGGRSGDGWVIGVRNPKDFKLMIGSFKIEDNGIATSGSYERFSKIDNKKFSHIIDPQSGRPVKNDLISVTVVAEDCMKADALATAVFVLGKDKGISLINGIEGVEGVVIDGSGKIYPSDGLKDSKWFPLTK